MYRIEINDMDLEQLAASGQSFRMKRVWPEGGVWCIPACGEYVEVLQQGNEFLFSCEKETFDRVWASYFDMETDYEAVKRSVDPEDSYLKAAMEAGWGVRILRQDLWEMVVTFLISQNNNITRITNSVESLCTRFGTQKQGTGIDIDEDGAVCESGRTYDTFPGPEEIAEAGVEGLEGLGLGYRDRYIAAIAERCSTAEGKAWLEKLGTVSYAKAHEMLTEAVGIGKKVADCICLFGLHHVEVFPVDTHVKQIVEAHYPRGFPLERYQGYAGILQQYMFYYKISRRG